MISTALYFLTIYGLGLQQSSAFVRQCFVASHRIVSNDVSCHSQFIAPLKATSNSDDPKSGEDGEKAGLDLAAEFAKFISDGNIELLDDEDEEDEDINEVIQAMPKGEDDEEEEAVDNIPMSKINIFRGRDEGKVGKLAGNVTLTNRDLYENLKERVLESPSAFVDLVGGDKAAAEMEEEEMMRGIYKPPSLKPDSGLTAGEVVELVLQALLHNDEPRENYGVEVFFAYSSPHSFLKTSDAPTILEYSDFIKTSEYAPLMSHTQVIIDKADYSYDKKKAFYNVRLREGPAEDRSFTSVNFILSKNTEDDDCWLIDSAVVRTEGLGRGRRRR